VLGGRGWDRDGAAIGHLAVTGAFVATVRALQAHGGFGEVGFALDI
jgi:hypothetical protein